MRGQLTGSWTSLESPWHNVLVVNCDVCGKLIPRRTWRFSDRDFGTLQACDPDCERLWNDYLRLRRLAQRSANGEASPAR